MENNIFTNILDVINYKNINEVKDGKIADVEYDPISFEMNLLVSFPKILPVKIMADFNKCIKEGLVKEGLAKVVNVKYKYDLEEIDEFSLKEYYKYTVDALKDKKIIYRSLDCFNTDFSKNEIKLWIGKGNDETIIKPLFDMVEKSFVLLGLNFVKFIIEVNPMILPVSETISISRKEDAQMAQVNASIQNPKFEQKKEEPKKEKTYKMRNQQKINGKVSNICDIPMTESAVIEHIQKNGSANFVIVGVVSNMEIKVTKKGNYQIYSATITDETGSIIAKTFINSERNGLDVKFYQEKAHNGDKVRIYGYVQYDNFTRDVVIQMLDIISHGPAETKSSKTDDAIVKRVELHAHSKMTALDSVLDIDAYVKRAISYNHRAIALTDKNSVQGLGELLKAIEKSKSDILPIYGMEAYMVDEDKLRIAFDVEKGKEDINLKDATYVVLDFETTGLSPNYNKIIEIGACKVKNGSIIDEFSTFVNPRRQISSLITNLTSITNDDVRNAPYIEEIMPKFKAFCDGCILVAHNAEFDSKHLYQNLKDLGIYEGKYPFFDTLGIARTRYNKKLKKFGLEDLCKLFNVSLEQHHRACDDAKATAQIFIKMLSDFATDNINNYKDINDAIDKSERYKYVYPEHITLLSKTREGLVNLNRIVSDSNTSHYYRGPRLVKSFLNDHRNGLLIGSSCFHGKVFETALHDTYEELLEVVDFFDFIEVQPIGAYSYITREDDVTNDDIKEIIKKIIKAAKEKGKLVVATGDVHELDKEDTLIVLGDFGFIWRLDTQDVMEELSEVAKKCPCQIAFLDGNHENFDRLYEYPVEEWNGGKIHRIAKNIIHLMRGQVFEIDGKTIFTFGGAISVDRVYRKEHISWWKEEMPTEEDLEEAKRNLERYNNEVDYIITHTCDTSVFKDPAIYYFGNKFEIFSDNKMLDYFEQNVKYKHWYFGHYHFDYHFHDKKTVLYNMVVEI